MLCGGALAAKGLTASAYEVGWEFTRQAQSSGHAASVL